MRRVVGLRACPALRAVTFAAVSSLGRCLVTDAVTKRLDEYVVPTKVASECYVDPGAATWTSSVAAAARGSRPADDVRWWLMDTGCPLDLTGIKTMSQDMKDSIEKCEDPVVLETPAGTVKAKRRACVQVEDLGEDVEPLALKDSPDVLSIGRRCVEHGYGFHWDPFSEDPFLVTPNGDKVKLRVFDYVPYLPDKWNAEGAPVLMDHGRSR